MISLALCAALAAGCDRGEAGPKPTAAQGSSGAPARPGSASAATKARPCAAERRVNDQDSISYLPANIDQFCLDPTGSDKAYGEDAKQGVDGICEVVDGECELYKRAGVRRFLEARYVDGSGTAATIDVYLSRYGSADQAFAMYGRRTIGDGDPAHAEGARQLTTSGRAALGQASAVLWRGSFLAELTLSDERASAPALKQRADEVLPRLVSAVAGKLPGATDLPAAARALPEADLVPGGIRYFASDMLGIDAVGPGAVGYYASGEQRWRALRAADCEVARAKDTLRAFARRPGATKDQGLGEEAVRFMGQDATGAPLAEWLVTRAGAVVIGVGDESTVLREGMPASERTARTLSTDDKRARLRSWLAEGAAKGH